MLAVYNISQLVPLVGEEDEVSIKEVAVMIAEAMDFKGELVVRW